MDNFNTNHNGWQQGYDTYRPQVQTNITLVTSLEEAIMRTNARPSDMVYFDQGKDILYRVRVDMDGKKYWKEIPILVNQDGNSYVNRLEFDALSEKVNKLLSLQNTSAAEVTHE